MLRGVVSGSVINSLIVKESDMLQKIKAFIKGITEARLTWTTSYEDYSQLLAYDAGRETFHRFTFRHFEP